MADSLSFLYLDMVRVVQDDTGVCAQIQLSDDRTDLVYIPTAALSCLLFGPGWREFVHAQAHMITGTVHGPIAFTQ